MHERNVLLESNKSIAAIRFPVFIIVYGASLSVDSVSFESAFWIQRQFRILWMEFFEC